MSDEPNEKKKKHFIWFAWIVHHCSWISSLTSIFPLIKLIQFSRFYRAVELTLLNSINIFFSFMMKNQNNKPKSPLFSLSLFSSFYSGIFIASVPNKKPFVAKEPRFSVGIFLNQPITHPKHYTHTQADLFCFTILLYCKKKNLLRFFCWCVSNNVIDVASI